MDQAFLRPSRFGWPLVLLGVLTACSTSQEILQSIPVTPALAPANCHYLGRLTVLQPHGMQSGWMPSIDQQSGVMDQLRKQAYKAGANYVQILAQHAMVAVSPDQVDQQSKTSAIIYHCP